MLSSRLVKFSPDFVNSLEPEQVNNHNIAPFASICWLARNCCRHATAFIVDQDCSTSNLVELNAPKTMAIGQNKANSAPETMALRPEDYGNTPKTMALRPENYGITPRKLWQYSAVTRMGCSFRERKLFLKVLFFKVNNNKRPIVRMSSLLSFFEDKAPRPNPEPRTPNPEPRTAKVHADGRELGNQSASL